MGDHRNLGLQIANCEKKTVFRKRGTAMIHANVHGYAQQPYRCVICGHWHLTSKTGRVEIF